MSSLTTACAKAIAVAQGGIWNVEKQTVRKQKMASRKCSIMFQLHKSPEVAGTEADSSNAADYINKNAELKTPHLKYISYVPYFFAILL